MEPAVRFVVPGEPRGMQRARSRIVRTKEGRQFVSTYTPAQSRAEQGGIKLIAAAAMRGRPPLSGPVELRASFFMPVPRSWSQRKQAEALRGALRPTGKPDFDNLVKLVADAVRQVVWQDDAQIVAAHIWKLYSDTPRVVVEVRDLALPVTPRLPLTETTYPLAVGAVA